MELSESREMYLETILILSKTSSSVHAVDICEHMNFSRPSVSRALKHLNEDGYINISRNKQITLTEAGMEIAESMYERHMVLSECLMRMGVSRENATADACRMEHVISAESFEAIKKSALAYLKGSDSAGEPIK